MSTGYQCSCVCIVKVVCVYFYWLLQVSEKLECVITTSTVNSLYDSNTD